MRLLHVGRSRDANEKFLFLLIQHTLPTTYEQYRIIKTSTMKNNYSNKP